MTLWTFERERPGDRAFYARLGWQPTDDERRPHDGDRRRRRSGCAARSRHNERPMTVTFADKLARMPHYEPGTSLDDARKKSEAGGRDQARLERVARCAAPRGGRGDRGGRRRGQPLPGPRGEAAAHADRRAHRDRARAASRSRTGPARSCSPPPRRSASPATEIVYAWPSFSIYPHMSALCGRARDPRAAGRGRRPRPRRDRGRDHRRDPDRDRLQPEQPDRDRAAGRADRRVPRRGSRPRRR